MPDIDKEWLEVLGGEFEKPYFLELKKFLIEEKKRYTVFPKGRNIFNAFNATPFSRVKVVVIGQDPYHGVGQAHGLCFSVQEGIKPPPSLVNIFKELRDDIGLPLPSHGNLTHWANQGVFLLNATLTVRAHNAGSHQNKGWEEFTDTVIRKLSEKKNGLVFLLWGSFAQKKQTLIDASKHHLLCSVHPSPLSAHRGFLGCKHFSRTNRILLDQGQDLIDWSVET